MHTVPPVSGDARSNWRTHLIVQSGLRGCTFVVFAAMDSPDIVFSLHGEGVDGKRDEKCLPEDKLTCFFSFFVACYLDRSAIEIIYLSGV